MKIHHSSSQLLVPSHPNVSQSESASQPHSTTRVGNSINTNAKIGRLFKLLTLALLPTIVDARVQVRRMGDAEKTYHSGNSSMAANIMDILAIIGLLYFRARFR